MGWGSHCVDKPDASADMRADACKAVAPLPLLPLRSAVCFCYHQRKNYAKRHRLLASALHASHQR